MGPTLWGYCEALMRECLLRPVPGPWEGLRRRELLPLLLTIVRFPICSGVQAHRLPHDVSVSQETRGWGKESDFTRAANRPRRWRTGVLKHRVNSGLIASFMLGKGSRLRVSEGCRCGKGPRRAEELRARGG